MPIIGIDVSKDKLDVLWLKDPTHRKVKTKIFANTSQGFDHIIKWATDNTGVAQDQCCFVMEATGVYHEALALMLHNSGCQVIVANPQHVRNYGKGLGVKTKTDKRDSFVIAHYAFAVTPALWQPEPIEIRQLKALIARLEAIVKDLQRERNRLEKARVANVQEIVITSLKHSIEHLSNEKKAFEQQINDHIDQHPTLKKDKQLLESIPGVGPVIASRMIALMRGRTFNSAAQAAAFCGLVPIEKESGSSLRKRPRLSKAGNAQFRAKLYIASVSAIKCNPVIQRHYLQLVARGKTKMAALGATMRKMVHICFGVLKHQQPFHA
ncbi:MAG: IS110 family transposase [Gammaproteobacteria bacterium]|nr:IS110 family transposase [Gammaproteobacteria bacterium]